MSRPGLFQRINKGCGGIFGSDNGVTQAAYVTVRKMLQNGLLHVFETRVELCNKRVACEGIRFEKESISKPMDVSDTEECEECH